MKLRVKDYLRAYFNLNILNHLEERPNVFSGECVAGTDLFFVDPWGNVAPCNGSADEWIMGNLKEQSFDEIWSSEKARAVREQVCACDRSCAFIGTARFDMLRHPVKPLKWIVESKVRLSRGEPIRFEP